MIQRIGGTTQAARLLAQFLAERLLTTTLLVANVAMNPTEAGFLHQDLLASLANPHYRCALLTLLARLFAECTAMHASSPSAASFSSSPNTPASGTSPAPSSPASTLRRESSAESPDTKKARKLPEDKFNFLNPAHESFWSYLIVCSELREAEHAHTIHCPGCGSALRSGNANNIWAHMTEKCKQKQSGVLLSVPAANFAAPSTAPAPEIVTRFAALSLPVKARLPEPWRAPLDQLVTHVAHPAGQLAQSVAVTPPPPALGMVPPAAAGTSVGSFEESLPASLERTEGSFGSNLSAGSLSQYLDPSVRIGGSTVDPQAIFRLEHDAHSPR